MKKKTMEEEVRQMGEMLGRARVLINLFQHSSADIQKWVQDFDKMFSVSEKEIKNGV